jgi:protein disulfide-isomerase A6
LGKREDQRPQALVTRAAGFAKVVRLVLWWQKYPIPYPDLCVIAFLPHILDSSQAERDGQLETIKEVGLKFRGKPFKFLWSQGGDHFDFEEKLGAVGVGYPVISVIYESKKVFGKLRKSFNAENMENFLNDILNNKARFNKLPPLEKLKTIKVEK